MSYYYLNFHDLNEEAQHEIMINAYDIVKEENPEIKEDSILWEKAEREMYNFDFVFNI